MAMAMAMARCWGYKYTWRKYCGIPSCLGLCIWCDGQLKNLVIVIQKVDLFYGGMWEGVMRNSVIKICSSREAQGFAQLAMYA